MREKQGNRLTSPERELRCLSTLNSPCSSSCVRCRSDTGTVLSTKPHSLQVRAASSPCREGEKKPRHFGPPKSECRIRYPGYSRTSSRLTSVAQSTLVIPRV